VRAGSGGAGGSVQQSLTRGMRPSGWPARGLSQRRLGRALLQEIQLQSGRRGRRGRTRHAARSTASVPKVSSALRRTSVRSMPSVASVSWSRRRLGRRPRVRRLGGCRRRQRPLRRATLRYGVGGGEGEQEVLGTDRVIAQAGRLGEGGFENLCGRRIESFEHGSAHRRRCRRARSPSAWCFLWADCRETPRASAMAATTTHRSGRSRRGDFPARPPTSAAPRPPPDRRRDLDCRPPPPTSSSPAQLSV